MFSTQFVFKQSGFDKFYQDVECGAFLEYNRFRMPRARADGSSRAPSKAELREQVFGESWEMMSERERAEKLRKVVAQKVHVTLDN